MSTPKKIAIIGLGWLGRPLADLLLKDQWIVKGSTTRFDKADVLRNQGIETYVYHSSIGVEFPKALLDADALFLNVPPGIRSALNKQAAARDYVKEMSKILREFDFNRTHLIAASSTSIYPDQNTVMDESFGSLGTPSGEAGEALREYERNCLDIGGHNTTILRFAGLYGQDRHPVRFFTGRNQIQGGQQRVNMVSKDRCLTVIKNVLAKPVYGEILNVVDSDYPTREEFYTKACEELGLEKPVFAPDGKKAYGRMVSSAKIEELGLV